MRTSYDISTRVSPELSALIERAADDPHREAPPTLGSLRAMLHNRLAASPRRADPARRERDAALADEVAALIDEFGAESLAEHFVGAKASEGLSRIIEYAMANPAVVRHVPTLGDVREAMAAGLVAQLVGDGTLDPDEDQTLLAEIDALIERHGADVVAEGFVRFE